MELTYGNELIYINDINYRNLKLPNDYLGDELIARALSGVVARSIIKIKGLENLTIKELELFRDEVLIKAHRLMEDNPINNIKEYAIVSNINVDEYDMKKFQELSVTYQAGANEDEYGNKRNNVFYIPIFKEMWKDIIGNLKCKLQDWLYSFGYAFQERGWADERYMTFIKLIDVVNVEILNRKKEINEPKVDIQSENEIPKSKKSKLTLEEKKIISLNKFLNEDININFADDELTQKVLNAEIKILEKVVKRNPEGAKQVIDYINEFYQDNKDKADIIQKLNINTPQEIFNFVLGIDGNVGDKLVINMAYTDNIDLELLKERYEETQKIDVESLVNSDTNITMDMVLNKEEIGNIFFAIKGEEVLRNSLEYIYEERIGKLLAENMFYITGKNNNLDEERKVEKDVGMEM